MSKRESFLLRIDPVVLEELKRWAEAELRSTNSHIEYLLRRSLIEAGRNPQSSPKSTSPPQTEEEKS